MAFIIAKHNGPKQYMSRCRWDMPHATKWGEAFEWHEDKARAEHFETRRLAQRVLDRWWPNTQRAMGFRIEETK